MGPRWGGPRGNRHVRRHEKLLLALMIVATVFGAAAYAIGGVECVFWLIVVTWWRIWYGVVRERTISRRRPLAIIS
jgi:hypothetical protein